MIIGQVILYCQNFCIIQIFEFASVNPIFDNNGKVHTYITAQLVIPALNLNKLSIILIYIINYLLSSI